MVTGPSNVDLPQRPSGPTRPRRSGPKHDEDATGIRMSRGFGRYQAALPHRIRAGSARPHIGLVCSRTGDWDLGGAKNECPVPGACSPCLCPACRGPVVPASLQAGRHCRVPARSPKATVDRCGRAGRVWQTCVPPGDVLMPVQRYGAGVAPDHGVAVIAGLDEVSDDVRVSLPGPAPHLSWLR
jgi:hypothetical protein